MSASVWKGFLSFGLVSIPVRLYAAARSSRISLHQLHTICHTRLRQPLFCPTCNRMVERTEIVKGYEYEKGRYALIEPQDIEKITPESGRSMQILSFVKGSQIDPLYFDASYFVVPEAEGRKAYYLLLRALEESKRMGIAKLTMHQREYTVFIRPYEKGLALHTMYFANELREAPGYGRAGDVTFAPQEVKLAEQLVATLSEDFRLDKYRDEFQEHLKALIEAKQKGQEVAAEPPAKRAPVIDIMAALKKSLEKTGSAPAPGAERDRAVSAETETRREARKPGPAPAARQTRRRAHRAAS